MSSGKTQAGEISIVPVTEIRTGFSPSPWAFRDESRAAIAANWATFTARSASAFDGRVLLLRDPVIEAGAFSGTFFETDYSAFLGWRDLGYPDRAVFNVFAMAALRASDGAFLLGRMGPGTANPGRIYFAAGTPDPSDIVGDQVDLGISALRELHEETGLRPEEIAVTDRWAAVREGQKIALMREVDLHLPAEEARALILGRLAGLAEEELADIVIVRDSRDIDPALMPGFTTAYLEAMLRG